MFNKLTKTVKKVGKLMEQEIKKENKKDASIKDVLKSVSTTTSHEEMIKRLSKYKNSKQLIEFYSSITSYPFQEALDEYKELGIDIEIIQGNYIIFAEDKLSEEDKKDLLDMVMSEQEDKVAHIPQDYIRIIKSNLTDDEITQLVENKLNKESNK